jgi:DNA repair protein RadA/Sms
MKMRIAALELDILSASIINPNLLAVDDRLTLAAFPEPVESKVFAAVSSWLADGLPGPIPSEDLRTRAGLREDQVRPFYDGSIPVKAEIFHYKTCSLLQARLVQRQEQLLCELSALRVKTGESDPDLHRRIVELEIEIEALEPGQNEAEPLSLMLSNVEPKTVPWLWLDFIPLGRATLISGDPGSAKTYFCLDLASRLSRGLPWPDGSAGIGPAKTLYLTVEDDMHDTVRPRTDSLGGDPSMIAVYNSKQPLHLDLSSSGGLKRLESEIIRLGNVQLLVVDPIIDFSGDVNPNTTEEVRALLTPLIQLAARHNFALILIGHLNKAQTLSAIYRAGGTTSGWLGKCRAAFMIFRDLDDKPLRHVIPIKANLAPQDPPQLEFRIIEGRLEVEISKEEVDPDEQLNPQRRPKPKERDDAVAWLTNFFDSRNEIPSLEVENAAKAAGISGSTLKRAKKRAGFAAVQRFNGPGKSFWAIVRGPECL